MKSHDPLEELDRLSAQLKEDQPPPVQVVPQVMRRIRAAESASDRALALFAAVSCVAAVAAVVVGSSLLSDVGDPLGALFQVVPPIEFYARLDE